MKGVKVRLFGVMLSLGGAVVLAQDPAPKSPVNQPATPSGQIAPASKAIPPPPDGLAMSGGKTFFIKNLNATMVDNQLELSEGIIAWPNGEVQLKDGHKVQLQEGQLLSLEGKLMPLPPSKGIEWHTGTTSTTARSSYGTGTNPIGAKPTGQGAETSLGGASPNATKDKNHDTRNDQK
ncbi:MAG: hypothetical protein JWL90_28 [Chthoniobacteraceae bacterium]|nr:hypothetical protein [Chthoniobacteraceae bacterium]